MGNLLLSQDWQVKNAFKGRNDIKKPATKLGKIPKRFTRNSRDFCVVV